MTPCARSCCWTPWACAKDRACPCHWDERRPAPRGSDSRSHADPTANEAIRNIERRKKK